MSPEWIERWRKTSEIGDLVIAELERDLSEGCGYCDPRTDDFYRGADLLNAAIENAAKLLPDGWDSLQVLGAFEGIRDHLENLGAWVKDHNPDTLAAAAAA